MSSTNISSIYFESSWSILSSIGLVNVFIGFLVVGITRISPITIVPIVVSAAGAIADGLCYYAFYQDGSVGGKAVASGFADFFWLIKETGLSMYSYQILIRILPHREKRVFTIIYWVLILVVVVIKVFVMTLRIEDILRGVLTDYLLIDHLHIGYFLGIALVEIWSSYFLLVKFLDARSTSHVDAKIGLFGYLMKSTEIRLAVLALIGISRSVTFSFQTTAQSAVSITGQVDRFVYLLECMFPVIMFIDILAAKTMATYPASYPLDDQKMLSPNRRPSHMLKSQRSWPRDSSISVEMAHVEHRNDITRYRSEGSRFTFTLSSRDLIINR